MLKKIIYLLLIILLWTSLYFNFLNIKKQNISNNSFSTDDISNKTYSWTKSLIKKDLNSKDIKWPKVKVDIHKIVKSSIEKNINFDVSKIDKNLLTVEIFDSCRKFLSIKWENNQKDFLNNEFNNPFFDFKKSIDCSIDSTNEICMALKNIKNFNKYNLEDISLMLYWIFTNNFLYSDYEKIILDKNKLDFPELESDISYSKYYWSLVSWKIKNINDCVDIVYQNVWSFQ